MKGTQVGIILGCLDGVVVKVTGLRSKGPRFESDHGRKKKFSSSRLASSPRGAFNPL